MASNTIPGDKEEAELPSRRAYAEFSRNMSPGSCTKRGSMAHTLEPYSYMSIYKERIINTLCYVMTVQENDASSFYSDRCEFAYYYLGDAMEKTGINISYFRNAISVIHYLLKESGNNLNCRNIYQNINEDVFKYGKIIFDLSIDYDTLSSQLQKSANKCRGKYYEYLKSVDDAFKYIKIICSDNRDAYCTYINGIKKKYEDDEDDESSKLEYSEATVTDLAGNSPSAATAVTVTMKDLSQLPSRSTYKNLNIMWNTYSGQDSLISIKEGLRTIMEQYLNSTKCLNRILGTWYYVNAGMNSGETSSYAQRCEYFYYWLGILISKQLKTGTIFSTVLNAMYQELDKLEGSKKTCPKITTAIAFDKTLFKKSKVIFDFLNDYNSMKQQGLGNKETRCSKAYSDYLDDVQNYYGAIESSCTLEQNSNDPCCKLVSGKVGTMQKPTSPEIAQLTCRKIEVASEEGREVEETTDCLGDDNELSVGPSPSSGSATTSIPATVGGTIATIGLPTIGFFLYKYTDVFDGIKKSLFGGSNNTGGRNRGRRSTVRHQHFDDTFTGNDSSTLGDDGSTTLGGGGGGSSTLGGSSTDISTIYDDDGRRRPSTGRRERAGTNNRRPGNIRYYAT
ncbi:KIR protein [Plasmodium knowlesi strain H]|uniref:KIR protein n=3 Tax=Plasmodium knowlesi TaxID=5850 RepID=A0A5E7WUZ4_PLAKH|nr:KIR protein [Plasmodium knowlesi strain H]OTN66255.1 KIR protein [Plasmodium knowlesi]CAA9986292.1 KIR protein [Plasmodium knowlesi strain H]SBO25516.1 KIR protein [Plasmodium knowlesi strain H]SBO28277.1 KIR protein [Plasmodium knowlesi strain H]VVS75766.1 KIR protein [Plasmodium knowlesi strain H]